MTKVPSLTYDKVIRALQRDGWVVVRQRGSHLRLHKHLDNALLKLTAPTPWLILNHSKAGAFIILSLFKPFLFNCRSRDRRHPQPPNFSVDNCVCFNYI